MKKVISVLIMLVILLSCVSCASVDNEQDTKTTTPPETQMPNNTTSSDTQISNSTTPSETQISNNTLNNDSNNASNSATTNKDTDNNEHYYPKHYEIELNMENYETYLFLEETVYREYRFSGVLTYAYYENVVIVMENTSGREYTIKLNAGGCCPLTSLGNHAGTVKSVSGKVIFNI